MCGRFAAARRPEDLAVEFEAVDATDGRASGPDYNAAPTKQLVVVRERLAETGEVVRLLDVMRWGLVPSWAKDATVGSRMINARIESVATKPAYRRAVAARRCLVPADGWFEWGPPRSGERAKQPYYMTPADGSSLAFAGLFEAWRPKDSEPGTPWLVTFTVITEPSVGVLREVHDRMPFVLPRDRWAAWLAPGAADLAALLVGTPGDVVAGLEVRPVSRLVNSVRNNGPELVAAV